MSRSTFRVALCSLLLTSTVPAMGQVCLPAGPGICPPEAPRIAYRRQIVEQTVVVPQIVKQKQTIQQQQIQYQQRSQQITVYDRIPQVVNVQRAQTIMTTETRQRAVVQTTYRPVQREVMKPVTVQVQSMEQRIGTRQVVKTVPVRVQKTMTTQCNCVQSVPGMAATQSVGRPVQSIVEVVENRQQAFTEQFRYQVPVTRNVTQYQRQSVVEYQAVQTTVNVPYQVQVPKQQLQTHQVVQYRTVPRNVVVQQTVAVPVNVSHEIEVPVTRYVQQRVQRTINVPVYVAPQPIYRSTAPAYLNAPVCPQSAACPEDCPAH